MIVIPMAGMSSRFQKAGYLVPKYMLDAAGKSLFSYAVESFIRYFKTETFLFVYREVSGTRAFIEAECARLGILNFHAVCLPEPTRGQAETVALALEIVKVSSDTPLTIFNIDTFRPGFEYPVVLSEEGVAGYLEVFVGEGSNWSFARTESFTSDRVIETAEKRPISNLCCTGLYYFATAESFLSAFEIARSASPASWDANEMYVAPLYNYLINLGKDIRVHIVDRSAVIFCGVPAEYENFLVSLQQSGPS